ncbi:MAG TPA: exonuclease SbcCD subunit D [Methanocorpusculum sp.]|nr:exonuclease SbcCD subunit D [Methanocorpusculum sp.]
MKFIHLADLHLGKKLGERDLQKDQAEILKQIIAVIAGKKADAVLISGDIYDKNNPATDAIELFEIFLVSLAKQNIPVFIIYGNHDSAQRLSYAKDLLELHNIYITDLYDGIVMQKELTDEFGTVTIHLLPHIKMNTVKQYFPEAKIHTLEDAVKTVVTGINPDTSSRNIILAHQFVVNNTSRPKTSDSEINCVGDIDEIHADIFDDFDYVALGHLHECQSIGKETIHYPGSPLKYSKSEKNHIKSVTLVTMKEKGDITLEKIPLQPLHDLREIKGPAENLLAKEIIEAGDSNDYIYVTFTDTSLSETILAEVARAYPNYISIEREVKQTKPVENTRKISELEKLNPIDIFAEFYEKQTGEQMNEEQKSIVTTVFEDLRGDAQ